MSISKNGKKKKTAARILVILTSLVLCLSMSFTQISYADDELGATNVTIEDLNNSIKTVNESVDKLKDIISPVEQSVLKSIFGDFTNVISGTISVMGAINTCTSFLKLIGVMKDPTAEALANITQQLKNITEKLADMDRKLDEISEEMAHMEAINDLNARGIKAGQMMSAWHQFEHDYMEDSMDELLNDYDTMMINHIRDWIEFKKEGARQSESDGVRTDMIIMLYKGGNPLEHKDPVLKPVKVNDIDPEHNKRDIAKPDPYTMYADDDDLNTRFDSFLILDDTFLPERGDIVWNVNTYRANLISFFKDKLKDLKKNANDPDLKGHYKEYRMEISEWTDDDIEKYAEGAVDSLMYRVNYLMINESADFAKDVYKEFGEYCDHVNGSQQGVNAMLSCLYLTNAFEFEAKDAIEEFCNQMILKTGIYSMFATTVLGMSEDITDTEKMNTAVSMCDAINSVKGSLNNGITGNDNYCYVTNTAIGYGDVTFSGNVNLDYYIRGAVSGYDSFSADPLKTSYSSDYDLGENPALAGDTNTLLIGYLLRNNGTVMDHDFLNEHFSKTKREKKTAMVTSLKGQQLMTTDTDLQMQTHWAIGGWFRKEPKIYLNSLPGSASEGYLVYRQRITGSTVDPSTLSLKQNRALFGTAAYGESHFYWEVDEASVMGGPCNDPWFNETCETKKTDDGVFTDSYTVYYKNNVKYNCLLQVPIKILKNQPGPYPLEEFKDVTADIPVIAKAKGELEKLIEKAEKVKNFKGWANASIRAFRTAIAEAKEICSSGRTTAKELSIEKKRLQQAWDYYKSIAKKGQKMKVKAVTKTVKAKALKKSRKVVKAITVKNAKGKVTYKKVSPKNKKFTVNKKTGKITIKKGLKKGTYKVKVKVRAAGNSKYLPAAKTVTVKIRVK